MRSTYQFPLNVDETELRMPLQLPCQSLRDAVEYFEKRYIVRTLALNRGQKGKTASLLGIDRKTLYIKMKKYELC